MIQYIFYWLFYLPLAYIKAIIFIFTNYLWCFREESELDEMKFDDALDKIFDIYLSQAKVKIKK